MVSSTVVLAQIVALFIECIIYGIYLVSFGLCLHILIWRKSRTEPFKINLIAVSCLMFIFATFDVVFGLVLNLDAFVYHNSSATAGISGAEIAEEQFEQLSYWVNDMRLVDYVAQTFIGDAMLLYRCYVVWGRRWKAIVFPSLLWFGGVASGITAIYEERTSKEQSLITQPHSLQNFIYSVTTITFVFNILTTSLIAYKIWSVCRETHNAFRMSTDLNTSSSRTSSCVQPQSKLTHAMRIIIESGAVYSAVVAALFGLYVAQSNACYAISDALIQIIGIVFNLIIIRVHQRRTCEFASTRHNARSEFKANNNYLPQFSRHSQLIQTSISVDVSVDGDGSRSRSRNTLYESYSREKLGTSAEMMSTSMLEDKDGDSSKSSVNSN